MLNRDFKKFAGLLDANGVEYLVVGGFALAAHGRPRYTLGYPPGRIDLLTGIDGVRFTDCYPRRQIVEVAGVRLPIIHIDDFKANERAAGRPRDIADLDSLDDESSG